MFIKSITYTDYNGLKRTEDHYFNLNKGELMEMQVTTEGGLVEMLKRIVANHDYPTIYKTFKGIVLKAYGVKSADGKRFMKVTTIRWSLPLSTTETTSRLSSPMRICV